MLIGLNGFSHFHLVTRNARKKGVMRIGRQSLIDKPSKSLLKSWLKKLEWWQIPGTILLGALLTILLSCTFCEDDWNFGGGGGGGIILGGGGGSIELDKGWTNFLGVGIPILSVSPFSEIRSWSIRSSVACSGFCQPEGGGGVHPENLEIPGKKEVKVLSFSRTFFYLYSSRQGKFKTNAWS